MTRRHLSCALLRNRPSCADTQTSKKGRKYLGGKGNFADCGVLFAPGRETSVTMAGPASSTAAPLLSVRNVSVRFGGIVALDGVTFDVFPGQIAGLIGPNGAGKTTLFNCLSRLYTPNGGDVLFEGKSILNRPRHDIPHDRHRPHLPERGAVRPHDGARQRQGRLPQPQLAPASSTMRCACPRSRRRRRRSRERALELIEFMDLVPFTHALAGPLPFPIRKRVELARALASSPKLLLLDEPAAGLNHEEVETLKGQIRRVRDTPARHGAAGRASHEPGDVGVGQGRRHRFRQEDRRRHAGRRCSATPK